MHASIEHQRHFYLHWALVCMLLWLFSLPARTQDAAALTALFPLPARPIASLVPLVQPRQVYSYQRLLTDAQRLAETYPGMIEVSDIGHSVFGRRIIAVRLGRGSYEITLNGSHHAREWVTSALLMAMLDRYALAYYRGEVIDGYDVYDLLNRVSIWVVPMVNPDGVALAQSGAASTPEPKQVIALNRGSRNFAGWKSNGRGVDLNRQYPARWEDIDDKAPGPATANYCGSSPLSEPETQAMEAFARQHKFSLHAALHAAGEIIFWHFDQTGDLRTRSERIAGRLRTLTGYSLVPPRKDESGGGYKDWVVQELQAPAFTIEVGKRARNGPVPLAEFPRIWAQMHSLGLCLAQEAVALASRAGTVYGYLDGRLVTVADSPENLQDGLTRRVQQGEGSLAYIIRTGESRACWRYPDALCYRVVVSGQTVTVLKEKRAAEEALAQALTEKDAAGGFVVTPTRMLVKAQGEGVAHHIAITPKGTITVDGAKMVLPERPCERQGRLHVSLAFFSVMGACSTFDASRQAVILTQGDTRLILPHGSALALCNGTLLRLDSPVYASSKSNTMAPLRSVAQALGGCVTVDPATGIISVRWYSAQVQP